MSLSLDLLHITFNVYCILQLSFVIVYVSYICCIYYTYYILAKPWHMLHVAYQGHVLPCPENACPVSSFGHGENVGLSWTCPGHVQPLAFSNIFGHVQKGHVQLRYSDVGRSIYFSQFLVYLDLGAYSDVGWSRLAGGGFVFYLSFWSI